MKLFVFATLLTLAAAALAVQDAPEQSNGANVTTTSRKIFTYAGSLLPTDWSVVSVVNERAIIGFHNGSARNAPISELDPRDRTFIQRLQNGTVYSTPLSSAKEKLSQWSSTVTSTASKLGKSVKEQLDSFFNNDKNKDNVAATSNITLIN